MRAHSIALALLMVVPWLGGSLQLNSGAFDTSKFNVSTFASSLPAPLSTLQLPDGSLAIASYGAGIQRFTDTNHDGIADGPGSTLYGSIGAHTGLVQAGSFYLDANFGDFIGGTSGPSISVLKPGATPSDPLTSVGSLQFSYPVDWLHNEPGIATRPTPGLAGSYDLVFNVGSENDNHLSADKVQLTGLATATLDGDSLYEVTLNLSGPLAVASNLHKIATGTRNVIGMGFQPGTGDFYFADNAINGPGPDADEPPQAEELNRIAASALGVGAPLNFGYPDCYIGYRTGTPVGSGCQQPFFAIQPLPDGTILGSEAEGVTQLAFAPANFPAGFNNGIFLGFDGKGHKTGSANEENAVGYYSFDDGSFIHFSENSQNGVYEPIGISASADSLFISDFGAGKVYQVSAASPEPSTFFLLGSAIAGPGLLRRKRANLIRRSALRESSQVKPRSSCRRSAE